MSAPVNLEPRVLDGYVGEGYGIAGEEIFALIAELSRLEGLVLDPVYTGKAFAGMLAEIAGGRFEGCQDIVFVHTGGIFGLFPQRSELQLVRYARAPCGRPRITTRTDGKPYD